MKKLKFLDEVLEFENIEVGVDYIIVDGISIVGLSENAWDTMVCDEIDILAERDKAIAKLNQPTDIEVLQEENILLMTIATELYERNLQLEEQNVDVMLAIAEIYEMSI